MSRFVNKLRPPDVPIDADIRWVLLAAFADGGPRGARPASPERAARLIQQLSLVSQVASRLTAAQLARALTPALQEQICAVASRRVMRSLAVVRAREAVCRVAAEADVEIVLLKQAALEAMGMVTPAQRYATDVDLLVRPEEVTRISDYLIRLGFVREKKIHAHGVVVVRSADGIGVELHTNIVDVRLRGDDLVPDFSLLKERGLIRPSDDTSLRIWIPALAVLGAHLVAQGWLLFHFVPNAPLHKSPIRVIVDLGLLGVHSREGLVGDIFGLIKHQVPAAEFFGLVELVGRLADGDIEHLSEKARTVFNHAMAALLDDDYRHSLLLIRQRDAISREGVLGWSVRQFKRAIVPSPELVQFMINSGKARHGVEARLRIPWNLAMDGFRGVWSGVRRRKA